MMKTGFPALSLDADLSSEGALALQQSGLRAVPVMRGGELVGMLTVDDVKQASMLRPQQPGRSER